MRMVRSAVHRAARPPGEVVFTPLPAGEPAPAHWGERIAWQDQWNATATIEDLIAVMERTSA